MAKPRFSFIDAKQLRELCERALDTFALANGLCDEPPDPETEREATLARTAALEATRFCSCAIAQLCDPSLWDLAVRIAEDVGDWLTERMYDAADGTDGVAALIARGRSPRELEYCASHAWTPLRLAVASSVAADAAGAPLLRRLTEDPDPGVRKTAAKRLAKIDEVPWWAGRFTFDPFEGMAPEEAERHKPAVMQLAEVVTSEYLADEQVLAALELAAQLPARLGCDVVKRLALAGAVDRVGIKKEQSSRAASVLVSAGELGAQTLESLLDAPKSDAFRMFGAYAAALPEPRRFAALKRFLELLEAGIHEECEYDSPEYALAQVIGASWPEDADPTPVLDLALAREAEGTDLVASSLGSALERTRRLDLVKDRLIAAHLQGYGGAWHAFGHHCAAALRRLPLPELDELVKRSLASGVRSAVQWGIQRRLEDAEAKSGEAAREVALALDGDPALRPVIRESFTIKLLPRLRQELREGKLDYEIARRVLMDIGRHWGGTLMNVPYQWAYADEKLPPEVALSPPSKTDLAYLVPESCQRPAGVEEWSAYRRALASAQFEEADDYTRALYAHPSERPWHPDDRALFERALAHAEREPDAWLVTQAGWVLFCQGEAADLPVFDRLEKLAGSNPDARPQILNMRREFRKRLGLPALPPDASSTPDQDDDDDGWGEEAD